MQKLNLQAQVEFPSQAVFLKGTAASDQINIFLHGYGESAEVFYKRVQKCFKPKHDSLFFNGPFPMPTMRGDIVLYQFAWYFFNPIEKTYYIDFKTPISYIKNALAELQTNESQLANKKINIIGYSQGAYLAPFLAQGLGNVNSVYCINGSIREDLLTEELSFNLVQFHAENDDKVEFDLAKSRFDKLSTRMKNSTWETIIGENHFLSEKMIKALEKYDI